MITTTEIKIGVIKFVITEIPKKEQLIEYETLLKNFKVNFLIRIVDKSLLYEINVPNLTVIDFTDFEDGSVPSKEIVDRYISIIEDIKIKYTNPIISIHCYSSLGRAPTLICISMIKENPKINRYDMILYVRKKRPGAFNSKQLNWLLNVKIKEKTRWEFWKKYFKIKC